MACLTYSRLLSAEFICQVFLDVWPSRWQESNLIYDTEWCWQLWPWRRWQSWWWRWCCWQRWAAIQIMTNPQGSVRCASKGKHCECDIYSSHLSNTSQQIKYQDVLIWGRYAITHMCREDDPSHTKKIDGIPQLAFRVHHLFFKPLIPKTTSQLFNWSGCIFT